MRRMSSEVIHSCPGSRREREKMATVYATSIETDVKVKKARTQIWVYVNLVGTYVSRYSMVGRSGACAVGVGGIEAITTSYSE